MAHLHWLGHASFRFDGPPTIYIDLTTATSNYPPADVILISHDHGDHYAPTALKRVSGPGTIIITTPDIAQELEETDVVYGEVRALQPGEQTAAGEVQIETVPAYNIGKAYHPKEAGYLGFIITFEGERLYFAGDTDHIPEMADIECDVVLLPIGGTYTMDIEEAAQAAAEIGAKVTVPMHERSADPEEFRDLCECGAVVMEVEF
jgi:L-ascorbate metabolism protein UlaG (beta-lactamase superfamily)